MIEYGFPPLTRGVPKAGGFASMTVPIGEQKKQIPPTPLVKGGISVPNGVQL